MKREMLRIVAIMMVVVFVSMCWMTPISYAWVLVDDLLVLLVGGLLITCGIVFTSDAQMQSAIQHAIANMPSDLRQSLDNVIYVNFGNSGGGGGGNKNPKKNFRQILEKIAGTVTLGVKVFNQFKTWACDLFKITPEVVSGKTFSVPALLIEDLLTGRVELPANACISYDGVAIPPLPLQALLDAGYPYYILLVNHAKDSLVATSFYLYGTKYPITVSAFPYADGSVNMYGKPLGPKTSYSYCFSSIGVGDGAAWYPFSVKTIDANASLTHFIITGVSNHILYSNTDIVEVSNFPNSKLTGNIYHKIEDNYPVTFASSLSAEAYNYGFPDGQTEVSISIPENLLDMIDKNYRAILDDYSLENLDWQASLNDMKGQYEGLKDSLGALGMTELEYSISLLQDEIDALNQALEKLGVDGLGGLDALNDALVDSAWALNDLKDAVKANEAASADELAVLRDELAQAMEKIQELLNTQTEPGTDPGTNPGVDPPLDPPSSGEIDWSILLGIKIFDKFPFSIPADIMAFVEAVAAPPKEPVFEFDVFGGMFGDAGKITLDFKQFDDIRLLIRSGFLILLVVGLIGSTKQYIWTGGG